MTQRAINRAESSGRGEGGMVVKWGLQEGTPDEAGSLEG